MFDIHLYRIAQRVPGFAEPPIKIIVFSKMPVFMGICPYEKLTKWVGMATKF
jgi:hypothetical protein